MKQFSHTTHQYQLLYNRTINCIAHISVLLFWFFDNELTYGIHNNLKRVNRNFWNKSDWLVCGVTTVWKPSRGINTGIGSTSLFSQETPPAWHGPANAGSLPDVCYGSVITHHQNLAHTWRSWHYQEDRPWLTVPNLRITLYPGTRVD